MNQRRFLFVVGILLICLLVFLFYYTKKNEHQERKSLYHLTVEEKSKIKEGDIIFRQGFGLISDAIVRFSANKYAVSHCGIVVKDSLNNWQVIHTVSGALSRADGMQMDKLDEFVRQSHVGSVLVTRLRHADSLQIFRMVDHAKQYLQQKIPFDERFDSQDTTAFFCTEFIGRVLESSDTLSFFPNKDYRQFEPLWDSVIFEIVIFPRSCSRD